MKYDIDNIDGDVMSLEDRITIMETDYTPQQQVVRRLTQGEVAIMDRALLRSTRLVHAGELAHASTEVRWRHKKRGTIYAVIGEGIAQASNGDIQDDDPVILYRSEDTGKLWVRSSDEFHDGRFELVPYASASTAEQSDCTELARQVLARWCGSHLHHFIPVDPSKGEDPAAYLELHDLITDALSAVHSKYQATIASLRREIDEAKSALDAVAQSPSPGSRNE